MHDTATPTTNGWRHIERYAYVQRPYEDVWSWLAGHLSTLGAPLSDGTRAVELRVRPGGHEVSRPVRLHVGGLVAGESRSVAALQWADAAAPQFFPQLEAELEIRPVPSNRAWYTQLGVLARYRPPFGALGAVGDRLIGSEVTDASLTTFLDELAEAVTNHTNAPQGPDVDGVGRPADDPGLRRVLLTVDGLAVRPGGATGLSDALGAVPGVSGVSLDPWTGLVLVDYHPERCSPADLAAAADAPPPT
jgi:hypothetical protein